MFSGLKKDLEYGLVLYSDGGEDKKTNACGWGIHGYLYPINETSRDRFKKDKAAYGQYGYVNGNKVAKDRTFKLGDRRVAPGPLFRLVVNEPKSMDSEPVTPSHFIDFYEPLPGDNSTKAEVYAMYEALKLIESVEQVKQAVVIVDSEYVAKALTEYYPTWERNGGRKSDRSPVSYWDEWQAMMGIIARLTDRGTVFRVGWTASHVGEPGNELADACATRGKIAVLNSLGGARNVTPTKDYFQRTKTSSRLLEQRWWYGINNQRPDAYPGFEGKSVYFLGNHGKAEEEDDLIGKYTSSAKIAILVTPNKEPVLEALQDYLYDRFYEGVGLVTLGYLENITNSERYVQLLNEGRSVLYPKENTGVITTPDNVPVLKELRPTYHGLRLLQNFNWHLNLLSKYLDKDKTVIVTDITDKILVKGEKKNKVSVSPAEAINPPHKSISIPINYRCGGVDGVKKVPFKLGQDIPLRNTFNAIADESTKVFAITWQRSSNEFHYATVVHSGDDILFTASLKANLIALVGQK